MLNVIQFSQEYRVKVLTKRHLNKILKLCVSNPLYYEHCPPFVSRESIIADMQALPPNKSLEDKFYVGYFYKNNLVAVLDLIADFPTEKTAFIGFFMVQKELQGKGIGSKIIKDLCAKLKEFGFLNVRLGFVSGNLQSENFWQKNGFLNRIATSKVLSYDVIYVEKCL